jgi:pimeloyl-ACP methyl ester carboxylesterase
VSLLGWSLGGLRTGGYAARHPDKVDKLVLFAPLYLPETPSAAPADFPRAGVPMTLQTHTALMQDRWGANVTCEGQVEPGIQETVWQTIMSFDSFGSVWGPAEGVMRVRTAEYWGWNPEFAARVTAPTLILVGLQDSLLPGGRSLYDDLAGTADKVIVEMECATHFALWETSQYAFMHAASREWLESGEYRGARDGRFTVGFNGARK